MNNIRKTIKEMSSRMRKAFTVYLTGVVLLVFFFVIGVLKTCVNFDQVKRP